jgi:predicted transcriptional regulator
MDRTHHLGALQHAIMRVLWANGEATVSEVQTALADEAPRALTTVATMLSKLEKKGVVAHRREGRSYVYRPLVSETEVRRSMVADLTTQLFRGDFKELVSHLIDEQEIRPDDLDRIKRLIEEREAEDDA